jgi:hypothetical protein
MTNFNKLENVCLHACASATGINITDILGAKKDKETVMARALTCSVLGSWGFGIRQISRITNTDPKGVSVYLQGHDNRMANKRYFRAYGKSMEYIRDYENHSEESLTEKIDDIYSKYLELEGKYEHLKELLTSD